MHSEAEEIETNDSVRKLHMEKDLRESNTEDKQNFWSFLLRLSLPRTSI